MFFAFLGLELVPDLHEVFPHIPWVGCFQGEQVVDSHATSRRWPTCLMSLNICSFPYAAQLRLGLEKLKKSSKALSDGTIIKSQCPDQIVVWVITSFFFSSPAVLFGYRIHKWPLWLLSSCHFPPPRWLCVPGG